MWIPKAQILAMSLMLASVALSGCLNSDDIAEQTTEAILGCTYSTADNYNAEATEDDGSCQFETAVSGCTDSTANNYNAEATEDDGSCTYDEPESVEPNVKCTAFTAPTEDSEAVIGELNSAGVIELLVKPGFVTVLVDCIDLSGNAEVDVNIEVKSSRIAGDPNAQDLGSWNVRDIDAGCWWYNGINPKPFWVVPCPEQSISVGLTPDSTDPDDNPVVEPEFRLVGSFGCWVQGEPPGPPKWYWVVPCPVMDIDDHLQPTIVVIDTNPTPGWAGGGASVPIIVDWSLLGNDTGHGEDGGYNEQNRSAARSWHDPDQNTGGVFVIDVVPVSNGSGCIDRCISGWPGKVNQHKSNGTWLTDPDGVSGWHLSTEYATDYADRKVEYCKKWWPDTTSVLLRPFRETISFYNAGNPEPPIPSTRDVYDCLVLEALDSDGDGLSDWDEMNIYGTDPEDWDTDGDGVSDGDEVNNGTDPLDGNCRSPTGWKDGAAEQNREAEPDRCWSNTRELEEYSVTIEREDDNVRTVRTFIRHAIGPGVYTIHVHTVISVTWYWLCPPHSPDFDDNVTWAGSDGHFSIPPWGLEPSPPAHISVETHTSDYYGENEHVWSYEYSTDTGPGGPQWGWVCTAGSLGEE